MTTCKRCPDCGKTKAASEFSVARRQASGLYGYCKPCAAVRFRKYQDTHPEYVARRYEKYKKWMLTPRGKVLRKASARKKNLMKNYGITPQQYEAMLAEQHGRCAICREVEEHTRRGVVVELAVDHEHETGKVRGLLCQRCNRAIGLMKENVAALATAIEYLNRHAIRLVADTV